MLKMQRIRSFERGLVMRHGEFTGLAGPGKHVVWPFTGRQIQVVDMRQVWCSEPGFEEIARSGKVNDLAEILEVPDGHRALVWIDNRFDRIVTPGLYVLWNTVRLVKTEIVPIEPIEFKHRHLVTIINAPGTGEHLEKAVIEDGKAGILLVDGAYSATLKPGRYAFWKNSGNVKVILKDLKEQVLDVSGQEIVTSDKVTLRLNALVTYRVTDPVKAVLRSADAAQSLYRDVQLALREAVGTRSLDELLSDKQQVASEMRNQVSERAAHVGIRLESLGIRDIILPGDMKDLMNRVTEAKKTAEANLVSRREEVAAMRSQANTARLLENNPGLIRMKELEILEKLVGNPNLKVVLGENGLSERVSALL